MAPYHFHSIDCRRHKHLTSVSCGDKPDSIVLLMKKLDPLLGDALGNPGSGEANYVGGWCSNRSKSGGRNSAPPTIIRGEEKLIVISLLLSYHGFDSVCQPCMKESEAEEISLSF
jgi:hypothetical protein